jgi:hypothetical protein
MAKRDIFSLIINEIAYLDNLQENNFFCALKLIWAGKG